MTNSEEHPDNSKLEHEGWNDLRDKPRWCTDVLFMLLLICCWIAMTIVGFEATGLFKSEDIPAGNPYRLVRATDYDGNVCGYSSGFKDLKYAYYLPDGGAVCVSSCPKTNDFTKFHCKYDKQSAADNSVVTGYSYVAQYQCMYVIETKNLLFRCLPNIAVDEAMSLAQQTASQYGADNVTSSYHAVTTQGTSWFTNFLADVFSLQGYIFGFGLGVTVGVAMLYLYLLRIPGLLFVIIWGVIVSIFIFLIVGSFLLWSLAKSWKADKVHSNPEVMTMYAFAYIGMGATVCYFCLMVVLRKRIQLAIGIVKQTCKALVSMPALLAVPLIQSAGLVLFLVPWIIYVLCLASSGTMKTTYTTYEYQGVGYTTSHKSFDYTTNTKYAFLYLLFCWFWTSEFIVAIGQMTIGLAFSCWYFTRDKSTVGNFTVQWAMRASLMYHMGTAAFGSLIIAIIKTVRAIVAYIQKRAKKWDPTGGKVVQFLLCIVQCILWCMEKIMKFINKNAYIVTGIYGYSFCKAARTAFFLIIRNILRVTAVNLVSSFILLIGILFTPIVTTFLCYLALAYSVDSGDITGIIAPLVFTFFISYWVTSMFIEIFGMGIETILICYIADEEMFKIEDRFADGDLQSTVTKTAQMHAAEKGKVGVEGDEQGGKGEHIAVAEAVIAKPPAAQANEALF